MLIASITEAKNKLSSLLDKVRGGESVLIVDRGRPVARLEPAVASQEESDGRLSRLERAGIVRRAAKPQLNLRGLRPARPSIKASVVQALLEERREGR